MARMAEFPGSAEITAWLVRWRDGDEQAGEQLFAIVHPYLRNLAGHLLQRERPDHTLEANAVVNELYLRLAAGQSTFFNDRTHFLATCAQTMRSILIDHARARVTGKRGGTHRRVPLSAVDGWDATVASEALIDLDVQLSALAGVAPRAARVVELRFFGGLSEAEIAEVLQVSAITVKRDWRAARAWLAATLEP
jgi:RNA polymerase sigma factor (TIGR02999 family)